MVRLRMNDWVINQGLIGLYRILKNQTNLPVEIKQDGFVIEREHLKALPQAYFNFFLNEYSVASREKRKVQYFLSQWKKGTNEKKKDLNNAIKDHSKKVGKYFSDTYEGKKLIDTGLRIIEQKEYQEDVEQLINEYIQLIGIKSINDKITTNYFKAVILGPYFGQPSFINVSKNKLNVEEQIKVFEKDYVVPILEEWDLFECINHATSEKEVLTFLKESVTSKPLSDLKKSFRKLSLQEIVNFLQTRVNRCSFFDDQLGFDELYEAHFSPLVLGEKNGQNFAWDARSGVMPPISSLAKLILFCSPAGATITNGRSLFVQKEDTFEGLLAVNDVYHEGLKKEKAFDEIVFDALTKEQKKAEHSLDNYLILEYESDYRARKTLLNYMMLTPAVAKLIKNHGTIFRFLSYRSRWPMLHAILSYEDPKPILFGILRERIEKNYSSKEVIFGTLIRHLYQKYAKEGEKDMNVDAKKEKGRIWSLYFDGAKIQRIIGETKAKSIAYRLLNASRSGDKNTFMDTALRVYISASEQIPSLLLEVLHEEHLDFPTVASAWIAGLISRPEEVAQNKEQSKGDHQ